MKALRYIYRHRAVFADGIVFFGCLVLACGIDGVVDLILTVL